MSAPAPGHAPRAGLHRSLERGLTWHAGALLLGACGAAAASRSAYLAIAAAVSFAALWRWRSAGDPGRRVDFSLPDALTASRLGVLLLALAAMPGLPAEWVLAAFSLNVVLDGLDGWVARRLGQTTTFGAVIDREVDALFVLVAYLYFHMSVGYGAWLLLPGLMPYLNRLLVARLDVPVPVDHKERLARPLAGANFVLLLAAVALPGQAPVILLVSTAVVLSSFGASFRSLARHAYPLP
jgi:phosphatidylserine synthase